MTVSNLVGWLSHHLLQEGLGFRSLCSHLHQLSAEPYQSHPESPGAGRVSVFKQACAYKETELNYEATQRRIYNYSLKQPQTKAHFINNPPDLCAGQTLIS